MKVIAGSLCDCDDILSRGRVIRLGLVHPDKEGVSYVVPLNYGYRIIGKGDQRVLYMHASKGHGDGTCSLKLQALTVAAGCGREICFEVETDVEVLPLAGGSNCLSTTRYCSVIGYGTVSLVTGNKKKAKRLKYLLRQNTGLPTQYLKGFEPKLLDELVIVELRITEFGAKKHGYQF